MIVFLIMQIECGNFNFLCLLGPICLNPNWPNVLEMCLQFLFFKNIKVKYNMCYKIVFFSLGH